MEKIQYNRILMSAICVAVASQINISLLENGLRASAGILFLPLFAFFLQGFPVFWTAAVASPLVVLLRGAEHILSVAGTDWAWRQDIPEIFFYLIYGALLSLYLKKISLHPLKLWMFSPLPLFDLIANSVELFVRMGTNMFSASFISQLSSVALVRGAMITAILFMLERYGFTVLRQEDQKRYQRLLLMTSMLRGELAWMRKSAAMIERTMNSAYSLYNSLRADSPGSSSAVAALSIARDIHEVKKEYMLIVRGVTEALDRENTEDGMYFREIWDVLNTGLSRAASDAEKIAVFTIEYCEDFYTKRHYELLSVFRNLLNNSLEAAVGDPVQIILKQTTSDTGWLFEVCDNCGGVPEKFQDKIFLEGFSSKINYETGEINRGLGLSLVRNIVESMLGGQISFVSDDGKTTFSISIPKENLEESV